MKSNTELKIVIFNTVKVDILLLFIRKLDNLDIHSKDKQAIKQMIFNEINKMSLK